jgi:hypothetical protein
LSGGRTQSARTLRTGGCARAAGLLSWADRHGACRHRPCSLLDSTAGTTSGPCSRAGTWCTVRMWSSTPPGGRDLEMLAAVDPGAVPAST